MKAIIEIREDGGSKYAATLKVGKAHFGFVSQRSDPTAESRRTALRLMMSGVSEVLSKEITKL